MKGLPRSVHPEELEGLGMTPPIAVIARSLSDAAI
jgi:hypothetical protein